MSRKNTNSFLKKACVFAGLLLTISLSFKSQAQLDAASTFQRNYLYHLSLVLPEHIFSTTKFEYGRKTGELYGVPTDFTRMEIIEELRTGITEKVEINLDLAYLISETEETDTTEVKRSGPRNFSLGFRYRWVEREESNYNFDLIARFSPDLDNATQATQTNDGNAFSGRTAFTLEAVLGRREQKTEFSIRGAVSLLGRETLVNENLGLRFRSNISYLARLWMIFQPRLKRGHYLEGRVGVQKEGNREIANIEEKTDPNFFGEISYTYKFHPEWAVGLEMNFLERNGTELRSNAVINQQVFSTSLNVVHLIY